MKETSDLEIAAKTPFDLLQKRIQEKEAELETLNNKLNAHSQDPFIQELGYKNRTDIAKQHPNWRRRIKAYRYLP